MTTANKPMPKWNEVDKTHKTNEQRKQNMKDRQFNIAFSVLMAAIVFVVLIVGYIAIFKHHDCMTRQQTRELVDSMFTEIYD